MTTSLLARDLIDGPAVSALSLYDNGLPATNGTVAGFMTMAVSSYSAGAFGFPTSHVRRPPGNERIPDSFPVASFETVLRPSSPETI